jgi:hypothetical protein
MQPSRQYLVGLFCLRVQHFTEEQRSPCYPSTVHSATFETLAPEARTAPHACVCVLVRAAPPPERCSRCAHSQMPVFRRSMSDSSGDAQAMPCTTTPTDTATTGSADADAEYDSVDRGQRLCCEPHGDGGEAW